MLHYGDFGVVLYAILLAQEPQEADLFKKGKGSMLKGTVRQASPKGLQVGSQACDDRVNRARLLMLNLPEGQAASASGQVRALHDVAENADHAEKALEYGNRLLRAAVGTQAFNRKYWGIAQMLAGKPLLNRSGNFRGIVASASKFKFFNQLGKFGEALKGPGKLISRGVVYLDLGSRIVETSEGQSIGNLPSGAIAGFGRWVSHTMTSSARITGVYAPMWSARAARAAGLEETAKDLEHTARNIEDMVENAERIVDAVYSVENVNKQFMVAADALQQTFQGLRDEAQGFYRGLAHAVTAPFTRGSGK
jgi:hypothetical protein